MTYWEAALLGLIQGLTEFLPVSSSGHLELGKSLVGLNDMDLTFSILVHGATACSTVVVFRNEIFRLVRGIAHPDLKERTFSQRYIFWLAISTIPAVIVAFTLRDDIESVFIHHPHRVGWSLCATAIILFLSERIQSKKNALSWTRSLGIGLAQAVAIIPGISRSGSTIGAAIAMGVSREEAARFSFLMALPVIFGATALEILELLEGAETSASTTPWGAYAVGGLVAFLSGCAACQWMIQLVKRTHLYVFAIYCLIAGVLALLFVS